MTQNFDANQSVADHRQTPRQVSSASLAGAGESAGCVTVDHWEDEHPSVDWSSLDVGIGALRSSEAVTFGMGSAVDILGSSGSGFGSSPYWIPGGSGDDARALQQYWRQVGEHLRNAMSASGIDEGKKPLKSWGTRYQPRNEEEARLLLATLTLSATLGFAAGSLIGWLATRGDPQDDGA